MSSESKDGYARAPDSRTGDPDPDGQHGSRFAGFLIDSHRQVGGKEIRG